MSTLIIPIIRRSHIPLALHRPAITPIVSHHPLRPANCSGPRFVRDEAALVVLVDPVVELVVAHVVECQRRLQFGEEHGEVSEREGAGAGVCGEC
jgi:hypothetical protein